jgi:hypothetical protein
MVSHEYPAAFRWAVRRMRMSGGRGGGDMAGIQWGG